MTTWQLRKKYGIKNPNHHEGYAPVNRIDKKFTPLIVPKKLEEQLPFKTKDKIKKKNAKERLQQEERSLIKPFMDDREKKAIYFIQRLKLIEKERERDRMDKLLTKRKANERWEAGMTRDRTQHVKKMRAAKFKAKQMGDRKK